MMKNRLTAFLLALLLCFTMVPLSVFAADVKDNTADHTVDIYLSISHDADFLKMPTDEIMAFKKLTVPYFDLALYGLQQYYFVSETYEKGDDTVENEDGQIEKPSSNLNPGNAEFAYGKITMLHALIYATEIYYCGVDEADAGKGYLKDQDLIGTNVFKPEGSVGSMYLRHIWNMNENLNYYHNYSYPLASEGWGSTADQILLHDGDIVTVGHFTNWSFHQDPLCVFNMIKAGEKTVTVEAAQNSKLDLTVYLAGKGGNYTTIHTPRTEQLPVYCVPVEDLDDGVVTKWNYLGNADENGNLTVDVWMEPGEYLICVAGQYGKDLPNAIVSTPGGILLTVTEEGVPGDVNGDGIVNGMDALRLKQYLAGQPNKTIHEANADVTGDGKVDGMDALRLARFLAGVEGVVLG